MNSEFRMIVAGGGTGGHFFPAQTICNSLRENGVDVKYMGSTHGIEATFFDESNKNVILLNIRGIQRHLSVNSVARNCLFPLRFMQSYIQAQNIIKEFKPHVVIGTGGYSSGLPLLAALHKGVKTVIQEQNSYPGIITRHLGPKVDAICIAFENALDHLKKKTLFLLEILFDRIYI